MFGLAIGAAALITGCGSAASSTSGGGGSSSGGITFDPSTFSCLPESSAFVKSSARLSSSVKDSDRNGLTWQLDGAKIDFGSGPLSSPIFVKQDDGSWLFADRTFVAYLCDSKIGQGIGQKSTSIGPHTITVLDAGGTVLAAGSFTVADSVVAVPSTATVSSAPSAAASSTAVAASTPAAASTAVATSTPGPGGGSGTVLDPCTAVTPAELETILGVTMAAGRMTSNLPPETFYPKGTTDCSFFDSKNDPHPYVDVKIGPVGAFPPDSVCHPDPSTITSTAVSLGDESCWLQNAKADPNGDLSELRVRKGNTLVAVNVFIPESQAQHQEATLKVVQLIIGRI